jgi:hypothetical protein
MTRKEQLRLDILVSCTFKDKSINKFASLESSTGLGSQDVVVRNFHYLGCSCISMDRSLQPVPSQFQSFLVLSDDRCG